MYEELIKQKRMIPSRLLAYGFVEGKDWYQYRTKIYNDIFELTVRIGVCSRIETELVEVETGEPYVVYKTTATGSYVGKIREMIEQVLVDIVNQCYETSVFTYPQTQRMIAFVKENYGDELEFLWEGSSDNAVWRRKDNRKWYAAVLRIKGHKIGLKKEDVVEIIDLRMKPTDAEAILSQEYYYPGWHMNKKSWYTLVMNDTISDMELKERIKESFALAKRK